MTAWERLLRSWIAEETRGEFQQKALLCRDLRLNLATRICRRHMTL